MLKTSGRYIVDENDRIVQLKGVNLGGFLVMENFMTPSVTSNVTNPAQPSDNYSLLLKLSQRFGISRQEELIRSFQETWITHDDLQIIRQAGYNTVRVPVWWADFYHVDNVSNSGFRQDAFDELDRIVNGASDLGLYVIIDMHGAVGGQSCDESTGHAGPQSQTGSDNNTGQPCAGGDGTTNRFWSNQNDQGNTQFLWWQIAHHYRNNPTVAGYDLLNEPRGAANRDQVINAYNALYQTVRSADPDHMIFLEGAFGGYGQWNWDELPNPHDVGWTNVVYEMHEYQWSYNSQAARKGADNQVTDFNNHKNYDVPGFIGEFNPLTTGKDDWAYITHAFNNAGLSWTMWTYKSSNGPVPNYWGMYDTVGSGPNAGWMPDVNNDKDSYYWIKHDWERWTTSPAFNLNTSGFGGQNF